MIGGGGRLAHLNITFAGAVGIQRTLFNDYLSAFENGAVEISSRPA